MKLTVENTAAKGKACRIFDAAGIEVKFCTEANTQTGEVEQFEKLGETYVMTECGTAIKRVRSFRPAPLVVEWLE